MKNVYVCIASLFLAACTTHHSHITAHPQARVSQLTQPVNITGKVDQVLRSGILGKSVTSTVFIYFDDVLHITGKLDRTGFGELPGISYQDKRVSSSCNSRPTGPRTAELSCIVFIDSQRVTTLVMDTKRNK
ncbi:MAG: hypothetical protein ACTS9Y_13360 [Methylophilus sp.]|uniref:hypothetical protein n=1 Tax=Methylophilus sp. TaxID=29541 RepID=UPI003F9F0F25